MKVSASTVLLPSWVTAMLGAFSHSGFSSVRAEVLTQSEGLPGLARQWVGGASGRGGVEQVSLLSGWDCFPLSSPFLTIGPG